MRPTPGAERSPDLSLLDRIRIWKYEHEQLADNIKWLVLVVCVAGALAWVLLALSSR